MNSHNQVFYELLLKSKKVENPVDPIWKFLQVLSNMGDPFVPKYLNLAGGRKEPVVLDDPQAIMRLLEARAVSINQVTSSFFMVSTDVPVIMVSFTVETEITFKINFPSRTPIVDVISPQTLYGLFQEVVMVTNPYWGCIRNFANDDRHHGILNPVKQYSAEELMEAGYHLVKVDDKKVPHLIHWVNYFGPRFVERLGGRDKLLSGPVWTSEEVSKFGRIIWILQQEPFDDNNLIHRRRQEEAIEYLDLFGIHKDYMLE